MKAKWKAILFVVVSFCVNFFGLDTVLSAIRDLLRPATIRKIWNFSCKLLKNKPEKDHQLDQSTPDATDFELAATAAKTLDLGNEDVISLWYIKLIQIRTTAIIIMQKLKLYGLYKQATQGDNNKPEPSSINLVAHAKWFD